ncbi:MAG: hypothetical protein WA709_38535, partial [Stellaceae bacterium]
MADDAMFAPLPSDERTAGCSVNGTASKPVPIVPVPSDAPQCNWRHPKHGEPVAMWSYHDGQGQLVGYTARVEHGGANGPRRKDVLPITYCRIEDAKGYHFAWRARALPAPYPLYRLPELLAAPEAAVIVTEGEKKADMVPVLFPGHVGTTSLCGARAAKLSEWAPLARRKVVIWPDHDEPGQRYADDAAALAMAAGAASVAIVAVPAHWPEGWDIADPLPRGFAPQVLGELLQSATPWTPPASDQRSGEADTAEIARLAALPELQYDREREATAKRIGCRTSTLNRLVAAHRGDAVGDRGQGRPLDLHEPEPWPQPVDGAALLDELTAAIRQYVILTERQAEATALWAIFTHAFDAFDFSPRLVIRSAEKRSGKTRVVEVLDRIVRKPLFVSGITAAALLRVVAQHAPAMLLDEIDTLMNGDAEMREAMRGLINSGFARAGA